MMPITPMSTLPSNEARSVTDDRISDESSPRKQQQQQAFVSTADGDVVVVEPSFDADDKKPLSEDRDSSWQASRAAEAQRTHPSPGALKKDTEVPSHARNLSSHFFDAARIKDNASPIDPNAQGVSFDDASLRKEKEVSSPAVGQKHTLSGDGPSFAHRRINSIGTSAPVERSQAYYQKPEAYAGQHHREGSEGLSMLSAAVHATNSLSKEELATAAGATTELPKQAATPWEPPSDTMGVAPPHEQQQQQPPPIRMSPSAVSANSYEAYPPQPTSSTMAAPPYRPPPPGYHAAAPPYYHQGSYYPPPPGYHHHRILSQGQPYPVQYAPPRGGSDAYAKSHYPQQAAMPGHARNESDGKIETDERLFARQQWGGRPGTTQGVQTFVTSMSVGEGNKMLRAAPTHKTASTNTDSSVAAQAPQAVPSTVGHHRKLSSFSSLSTLMGSGLFPDVDNAAFGKVGSSYMQVSAETRPPHHRSMSSNMSFLQGFDEKAPARGHHRSTSSSVSFLQGIQELEGGFDANEAFMNLEGQPQFSGGANTSPYGKGLLFPPYPGPGSYPREQVSSHAAMPPAAAAAPPTRRAPAPAPAAATETQPSKRLAQGGTSKRVRRKCTVEGCPNRVVQGGLCISHGAKRKTCKHPGCTKNVKKAGLCSTHGPARKRCDKEGCTKVAVQGGRCIAHGAKKKLCGAEGCTKQAILSGYCKRHHDQNVGRVPAAAAASRRNSGSSQRTASPPAAEETKVEAKKKPTHARGLSIFQEVSPENIQTILGDGPTPPPVDRDGNYKM